MCIRPKEDYVLAGRAIEQARDKKFSEALDVAARIPEEEARLIALQAITNLAAKSNDDLAMGRSLNLLSDADKAAYMEGLQARLVSLLLIGDLERASALQQTLLEHYASAPDGAMAIAQVAISYVTAGHVDDANAFLKRASNQVPGLRTEDLARLLGIMVKATKGEYPSPQDFFDFSTDEMRLQAYVQLAIFYERSGRPGDSARVAADMARFTQKSSVKVGKAETARAFGKVLIETM